MGADEADREHEARSNNDTCGINNAGSITSVFGPTVAKQ